MRPGRRRRARHDVAHDVADDVHASPRRQRRAELAQALRGERARDDDRVGVGDQAPLPQRQRRAVGRRLDAVAAAVQAHPRARVAAMAARAVRAAREARADRADEAVVVQVQDGLRPRRAGRGERAPAERRVEVVGVDDARAAAADGRRDVAGLQAAAEQAGGGAGAAERRAVARQQLRVLAELLAHEPQQVVDGALLTADRAVAVVQEEDHRPTKPRLLRGMAPLASIIVPTRERAGYLDVALASIAPQAAAAGAEVLVVDDGPSAATEEVARRHGARYVATGRSRGPERRAQHRHRGGARRAARVRRRRRRGAPRLARRAARRRRAASRPRSAC